MIQDKIEGAHSFSPAMHGWGVFPDNKRCSMQKKDMHKIDLFHQNKHDHQLFLQFLVKFLRNNIKYVVSSAVSGAVSGELKVPLFRTLTIQSVFSDDYFK